MRRAAAERADRSDAEIFTEGRHALDRRPGVPAAVHVHVEGGIATLTGTVQRPSERAEAEDALRQIAGVRRLVNEIAVARIPDAEGFGPPEKES